VAKVSIAPWKSKKAPDGTVPLYLVIRHKNQRSTVALPVRIKEKDWNAARGEIRKTHPDHYRLDLHLTETLFKDASISPHRIKATIMEEATGVDEDFLAYYESQLEAYRKRRQWATSEAYRVALNKLREHTWWSQRVQDRRRRRDLLDDGGRWV
jgi:hypothetical protein